MPVPEFRQRSNRPLLPYRSGPANDEIVTAQPALKTGSFQHPNAGESHAETRWQVFRDDDSTCVLDIQTSDCLTSLTVPKLVLEMGTACSGGPSLLTAMVMSQNGPTTGISRPRQPQPI